MERMGTNMKLWMCRDKGGNKEYRLFANSRCTLYKPCGWWLAVGAGGDLAAFCSKGFHSVTQFRLKPGEGPVEVKITVERVSKNDH